MKLITIGTLFLAGFIFFSCANSKQVVKPKDYQTVKVIKDCTGTYLRLGGKDYMVCNLEKTNGFESEDIVQAIFHKVENCTDASQPEMKCMMYHENEGWIEVESVNR